MVSRQMPEKVFCYFLPLIFSNIRVWLISQPPDQQVRYQSRTYTNFKYRWASGLISLL